MAQMVEETRECLIWACKFAKERGSKGIVLMGHSAGAHLCAQVFTSLILPDKHYSLEPLYLLFYTHHTLFSS